MEKTAHTPVTIVVDRCEEDDEGTIRMVVNVGVPHTQENADRAADLVQAAPDLLAELIAAQAALAMVYAGRTNWHGHLATLETVSAAMKSARAAIAKAEGR